MSSAIDIADVVSLLERHGLPCACSANHRDRTQKARARVATALAVASEERSAAELLAEALLMYIGSGGVVHAVVNDETHGVTYSVADPGILSALVARRDSESESNDDLDGSIGS